MGILSSIGKGVMKVMDTATVAFTHPVQTISAVISPTKTVSQVAAAHFAEPVSKQYTGILLATAGYAAATLGAGAVVAKGVAATAATLIPATIKGKIIAAVAAPVIIGAVVKEPAKILTAVTKAPSELAQFGGDVAGFAADPSLETAKQIIKESPIISAGVAAAAAIGIGAAVIPAISGVLTREEMKKQTEAFERQAAATEAGVTVIDKSGAFSTLPYSAPVAPVSAATQKVTAARVSTGRKRRPTVPVINNIIQKTSVLVNNRSSSVGVRQTKNYLNRLVLAQ